LPIIGISRGIYLVGGQQLSHPLDANVYLILRDRSRGVLVDSGIGLGYENVLRNILELGVIPSKNIEYVVLTHCHARHSGGASKLYYRIGLKTIAHEPDSTYIRIGDEEKTLARKYGLHYSPSPITVNLRRSVETMSINGVYFELIHTPGHTLGSLSIYFELNGRKIMIIGDALGPLSRKWNSDEKLWRKSLEKIFSYDFELLLTGHDYIRNGGKAIIEKALELGPVWIKNF